MSDDFMNAGETNKFRCPECGGTEPAVDSLEQPLDPTDPWGGLLPTIRCRQCRQLIPEHLARRQAGLSWREAQSEWRSLYRPGGS